MHKENLSASEALEKLKAGNQRYLSATANPGDVSPKIRHKTCTEGQEPYAIVITCSDSRVIPESIFSAGIGELFVIRVAGNVMDKHQLGSVEYAADHLGCNRRSSRRAWTSKKEKDRLYAAPSIISTAEKWSS